MRPMVQILSEVVYQAVKSVVSDDTTRVAVKLDNGGVIVTSSDGDHVHVLVQSTHFVPGEELPF